MNGSKLTIVLYDPGVPNSSQDKLFKEMQYNELGISFGFSYNVVADQITEI